MKKKFYVELTYNDGSERHFDVILEGREHGIMADLMMITRGTLMVSGAFRATAYNDQGFDVVSYQK